MSFLDVPGVMKIGGMMWDKNYKGRYILIEPTDYCNCNCIMCTRELVGVENPHNTPKGFMDFEVFKAIIDGLEFGSEPLAIKLFWIGESMLHPDFKKMLKYASEKIVDKNAYIDLHTNATLLNKEMIDFMLTLGNALPRITFSLDAQKKCTHEIIRRGGSLDHAKEQIKYFLLEREKKHLLFPRFIFQFIIMEENKDECNDFVKYWADFINENVKISLDEAWGNLNKETRKKVLEENGIYEEFYGN